MRNDISRFEIEETIMPRGYELAMELAHNLAFARHEGNPSCFAFLVGTDNVWPVLGEFLSADFGEKKSIDFFGNASNDPKFLARICEANYSIFQINGVAGYYNVSVPTLFSIVRLRPPSVEELRRKDPLEPIVDRDDLFCYCVGEIKETTGEKSCIIATEGDGRVRVYGIDPKYGETDGDLVFIWDISRGEIYRPVQPSVAKALESFLNDKEAYGRVKKVIRKISTTVGEGAMIILTKHTKVKDQYLRQLEFFQPEWQRHLDVRNTPKELLRAAFIMDGATLILFSRSRRIVEPRLVSYPHQNGKAYGITDNLINRFLNTGSLTSEEKRMIEELMGKGTKTQGAANLSELPDWHSKIKVITISADGPIRIWPNAFEGDDP